MNTITRLLILSSFFFMLGSASAQTSFSMDSSYIDSAIYPVVSSCPGIYHTLRPNVNLSGYNNGDTVFLVVYWGGGLSDTMYRSIWGNSGQNNVSPWLWFNHLPPGTYNPIVVGFAPDGKTDTSFCVNTLHISTCGNISGNIFFDADGDCVKDPGEYSTRWATVELVNKSSSQKYYASSDSAGEYSAFVPLGVYDVTLNSNQYSQYCPMGGRTNVGTGSNNADFGIQCGNGFDLSGHVAGLGFRPGNFRPFYVTPQNSTCNPKSGEVRIVLSDSRINYQATTMGSTPTRVNGDTVVFSFSNLTYVHQNHGLNQTSFMFFVYADTTLSVNDTVCFDMEIYPIAGDNDSSNNKKTYCFPVRNSFDPNDKQGQPLGIGPNNIIDRSQDIEYTIRFQNTGNDVAYKVVIRDTLPEEMDIASLEMLSTSHECVIRISEDREIKFTFDDINLQDSTTNEPESHGFVTFRLSQIDNLPFGTDIENKAYIYFDYNDPIVTNTTHHRVDIIDAIEKYEKIDKSDFLLYPNPTHGLTVVKRKNNQPATINVYSVTGKVVMSLQSSAIIEELRTDQLNSGIYFVEVLDGSREIKKLIIR